MIRKGLGNLLLSALRVIGASSIRLLKASPSLRSVVINAFRSSKPLQEGLSILGGSLMASSTNSNWDAGAHLPHLASSLMRRKRMPIVTVIVPVYNSPVAVKECLDSLSTVLHPDFRVLVIDDCSTEPEIQDLLSSYKERSGWTILNNYKNLGFTKTVNRGLLESEPDSDFVLLNSDTLPFGNWWQKLRYAAYRDVRIGTVTPFSDNSDAFSVPRQGVPNPPPKDWSLEDLTRAAEQAGNGEMLDVATGNGFCLYVKRSVIEEVGILDDITFPRGYGEENDFCMRALKAGWLNVVSDKVFVSHKGSASFGDLRHSLISQGIVALGKKHPEFPFLNTKIFGPVFADARQRVFQRINSSAKPRPRLLFVQPIASGGLKLTNEDLSRGLDLSYEQFRVRQGADGSIELERRLDGSWVPIDGPKANPVSPLLSKDTLFEAWFADIIFTYSIEVVHIEHMRFMSLEIANICRSMGVKSSFTVHDFYSICPTTHLLDETLTFCGGVCTKSEGEDCGTSFTGLIPMPKLKSNYVRVWQSNFSGFLASVDHIIAPSKSAMSRLLSVFPDVRHKTSVIEHGRDDLVPARASSRSKMELGAGNFRLAIPGSIGVHKGSRLLTDLEPLLRAKGVTLEVLGHCDMSVPKTISRTGGLTRSELITRLGSGYDAALFLSIWEETYAHTLTEAWAAGLTAIVTDFGALADRVNERGEGLVLSRHATPAEMAEAIISFLTIRANSDHEQTISTLFEVRSLDSMARDYLKVWHAL